ncbi:MAG: ribosome silencing factor [Tissierellaceae bacterium]
MDTENKLSIITRACEEKKGIDIKVLNITDLTPIADYFVIVSGNSSTQVMSIADEVEKKVVEAGYTEIAKEGYHSGRWILMDLDDIIVHVFHKEEREYYNLERLWSNKEEKTNEGEE